MSEKEFERLFLEILLNFSRYTAITPWATVADTREWMKEHPNYLQIKENIISLHEIKPEYKDDKFLESEYQRLLKGWDDTFKENIISSEGLVDA